jgi:hypothetical protein
MTIIALLAYQQSTVQRGKTHLDGKISKSNLDEEAS